MTACPVRDDWLTSSDDDLLTEAVMLAQSGIVAVVYVEGNTDARLLENLFSKKIKIIPAGNCRVVEGVVRKYDGAINLSVFPLILGFVDRDYKAACGELVSSSNIIYTHLRDIECVMLSTKARENLIGEYVNSNFQSRWKRIDDFVAEIICVARAVAVVRIWSSIKGKGVNFKNLDFEKFHSARSGQTDAVKMLNHIRGAQKVASLIDESYGGMRDQVSDFSIMQHVSDDFLFCRGHDVLNVMALYFKKGFGRSGFSYSGDFLESVLRIGAKPFLFETDTFKSLAMWFSSRGVNDALLS